MWIFKLLAFLWPFIKEMVLGDKTLKEAIKDNKKKVLFAIFVMASIGMNFFLMVRLVAISQKYLEIQKLHPETATSAPPHGTHPPAPIPTVLKPKPDAPATVVEEVTEPQTTPSPVKPVSAVKVPKKKKPSPPATNEDRYSRMKNDFDRIKEREEKSGL